MMSHHWFLAPIAATSEKLIKQKLNVVSTTSNPPYSPGTLTSSWSHMGSAQANPMGVEAFGLIFGLGFVLSFGYWFSSSSVRWPRITCWPPAARP